MSRVRQVASLDNAQGRGGGCIGQTRVGRCRLAHYRIQAPSALSSSPSSHTGSAPIDLGRVRQLFAKPERISDSAFLLREIAARMHERLALVRLSPARVLDAGCGAGADLFALQERYPQAQIVGCDASPAMLAAALASQQTTTSVMQRLLQRLVPPGANAGAPGVLLAAGDMASLPLAANMVDLIWSNLSLHWHAHPDEVFREWRRVLKVDGLLMFSCFGPDTFKEVREAFAEVDGDAHTLSFVDMHDFGDMLVNAGFATPVMDMEKLTVTYDSVAKMLADVRAFGGNPLQTRRKGLLSRSAWSKLNEIFERRRQDDGRLHLSFEVIYGHAFRPVARSTAEGEAIIRFERKRS